MREYKNRSLTSLSEGEFIDMLFDGIQGRRVPVDIRESLLNVRGLPLDGQSARRLTPPGGIGDCDIVLWEDPAAAVEIEVKRLKLDERVTDLANLEVLREGAAQANKRARLGFSSVYLWVVLLVDSRFRQLGDKMHYGGPTFSQQVGLRLSMSPGNLEPGIGALLSTCVQSMDSHLDHPNTISTSLCGPLATVRPQPPKLTEFLKALHEPPR